MLGMLALIDLSVRLYVKDAALDKIKHGLHAQYVQSFGEGAAVGEEIDIARYRVGQLEKSLSVVDASRSSMLAHLASLAKHIPAGVPLTVRELTIEGSTVHLEGETASFDAVEKIKQAFTAGGTFQEVSVSDTRVGSVANQVVFRLTYTVAQP